MKTLIITGANTGIGFAAAKAIAAADADWHIVLACRTPRKAERAVELIKSAYPKSSVETLTLDLASLESVRSFAQDFKARELPPLQALICNAGLIVMKGTTFTSDGFETTFGVNYLGHFLLVNLLIDHFHAPARIVFTNSENHDPKGTRFGKYMAPVLLPAAQMANPELISKKQSGFVRYGTSKLCLMLFAYELDRRIQAGQLAPGVQPLTVNSFTPSAVPTTQGSEQVPAIGRYLLSKPWFVRFLGGELNTEESAGKALARLVLDPALENVSGKYFKVLREIPSSTESYDVEKAKKLWAESEALVGLEAASSEALAAR